MVLGDIGRSPRMQYHALSLARQASLQVDIVAYGGTSPFHFHFQIILFFCVFLINLIQTFCRFWTPYGIAGESIYPYPQNGIYHSKILPSLTWISLSHHNTFDFNVFLQKQWPTIPQGLPKMLKPFMLLLKPLFQFLMLLWYLCVKIPPPDVFLVQVRTCQYHNS